MGYQNNMRNTLTILVGLAIWGQSCNKRMRPTAGVNRVKMKKSDLYLLNGFFENMDTSAIKKRDSAIASYNDFAKANNLSSTREKDDTFGFFWNQFSTYGARYRNGIGKDLRVQVTVRDPSTLLVLLWENGNVRDSVLLQGVIWRGYFRVKVSGKTSGVPLIYFD